MMTTEAPTRTPLPESQPQNPAIIEPRTTGPRMHAAQRGATTRAVITAAMGLSLMVGYSMTVEGKPAPDVAASNVATSVSVSSKVTIASFRRADTSTN